MVKKKVAAKAAKGYKLPDPIPLGQILTDMIKNQWKLGKSIGQGGFGEIYLASNVTSKSVADNSEYVVKIEPHSNGPLFAEMHCYMRIAKPDYIEAWKRTKKLKHLGMPKYFGSGSHEYKGEKYRFMIMQRFGQDLQKIIDKHEKMFSYKTVFQIMIQILDVLEYIHFHGYIHADIKASNLLVGHQKGTEGNVYLVDYGLACRYTTNGKHKEYKYDQRKAHDGTIEFTSRDAHIGAHSRRGDLEILGYNLVQWLCGKLPWEDNLQDCNYVANKKRILMDDIPKFMKICFPDGAPPGIQNFMEYVASLTFDETPNYEKCKAILRDGLKKRGHVDDGRLVFMSATPKANSRLPNGKKKSKRRCEEAENIGQTPNKKRLSPSGRMPCKPRNFNNRLVARIRDNEVKEADISLNTPPEGNLLMDVEEKIILKENLKMIERQKQQKHRRVQEPPKIDSTLSNPTPQMLEIMAKKREKSVSPPICMKKHHHNGNCQRISREPQFLDSSLKGTILTPAMEEVIRRRNAKLKKDSRLKKDSETSREDSKSPELFNSSDEEDGSDVELEFEDDSDDGEEDSDSEDMDDSGSDDQEEESGSEEDSCSEDQDEESDLSCNEDMDESVFDLSDLNSTVFYSPCGSSSPSVHCGNYDHKTKGSEIPVRSYSTRRASSCNKKRSTSFESSKATKSHPVETRNVRITRRCAKKLSPEI